MPVINNNGLLNGNGTFFNEGIINEDCNSDLQIAIDEGVTIENICPDTDNDGFRDNEDNCINQSNPDQTDTEKDGLGDACDPNPASFTAAQNGNWNDPSTWSGRVVPLQSDNKEILNGVTVTSNGMTLDHSGVLDILGVLEVELELVTSGTVNIHESGLINLKKCNGGIQNDGFILVNGSLTTSETSCEIQNFGTIEPGCDATIDSKITFVGNLPLLEQTVSIPLSAGWNLIGLPFRSCDSFQAAFGDLIKGPTWAYDNSTEDSKLELIDINRQLEPNTGYWLFANNEETIEIHGIELKAEKQIILLSDSWNLISPPFKIDAPYKSNIIGIWMWDGKRFVPVSKTLGSLSAGNGYWINSSDEQSYP